MVLMARFRTSGRNVGSWKTALQVRIENNTFTIGQQTVGAEIPLDPHIGNEQLEWYTETTHTHAITGVLVLGEGLSSINP